MTDDAYGPLASVMPSMASWLEHLRGGDIDRDGLIAFLTHVFGSWSQENAALRARPTPAPDEKRPAEIEAQGREMLRKWYHRNGVKFGPRAEQELAADVTAALRARSASGQK